MVAHVDDRQVPLVFMAGDSQTPEGNRGTLDLSGLPKGQKALTVTATDALGNRGQAQRVVLYDNPPQLTVSTPEGAVGRPEVRLAATCRDETTCTVEVHRDDGFGDIPVVIAAAHSSLDVATSISNCCDYWFVARDSLGQVTYAGSEDSSAKSHSRYGATGW